MTLGKRLKASRKAVKMTQTAVAERIGISRPAITQWESDATVPELEHLAQAADLYGVTTEFLLGGSGFGDNSGGAGSLEEEADFLRVYRALTPERKARLEEMASDLLEAQQARDRTEAGDGDAPG